MLIGFDSDPHLKDELARTPIDCIPDDEEENNVSDIYDNVSNIIDRRRRTRCLLFTIIINGEHVFFRLESIY